jgi:hypothetical protein
MSVLFALAIVAAGSFAAVNAFQSRSPKASAKPAKCPARTGTGAYDTTLRPTSGMSGSTVAVSGPLPVTRENGTYGGQVRPGSSQVRPEVEFVRSSRPT